MSRITKSAKNETICSNQFGFRKNHSTQQAITTLINKITNNVDSGNIAENIFIDLKKHSILYHIVFY